MLESEIDSPGRFQESRRSRLLTKDEWHPQRRTMVLPGDFNASPEGRALRFDASGEVAGVTIFGPRSLLERDGNITITIPSAVRIEVSRDALDQALEPASPLAHSPRLVR